MTDNFDDFDQEHHDLTGAEEAPAPRGFGGNLAEAWKSKPLFKLMVVMVGAAAVVAVGVNLFPNEKVEGHSKFVTPPSLHETPGGAVSPYMKQQTDLADKSRAEDALKNGGSALPTPIGQMSDIDAVKKDDSLNELKTETEHLKQQLVDMQKQQAAQAARPAIQQPAPQQQAKPEVFDESLAQAMQMQMKQLSDSWAPRGIKEVTGKTPPPSDKTAASASAGPVSGGVAVTGSATSFSAASGAQTVIKDLVSAGTVSYAQLLTEANSDVPGPILAQVLSGPLAGARAVGAFQVKNEYLVLQFSKASLKGIDYNISAVALDPDTTLGGMATEVDERYFTRVVLPAAASFMEGLGQALGQGNSSVTTSGTTTIATQSSAGFKQGAYQGLSQAATTAGQFFQSQANTTKVLVRVAAGTPIGLFFTQSVKNTADEEKAAAEQANAARANAGGTNGTAGYYNPGGYPGSTVTGYGGNSSNVSYPNSSDVPYPNFASPSSSSRGYGMGYPGVGGYGH